MKKIIILTLYFVICFSCNMSAINNNKSALQSNVTENSISSDNDIKESKSDTYFWWMILAIGVTAVIAVCSFFGISRDHRYEDVTNKLDKISYKQSKGNYNSQNFGNKNFEVNASLLQEDILECKLKISSLQKRICALENKFDTANASITDNINDSGVQGISNLDSKEVYLGNVKNTFFNDVFESCKDEAKFKATITNDIGTFEPIDLCRISSLDNIGNAVKYEGDILISAATGFVVEKKGEVHKNEGVWSIDSPAVIKLIK